MFYRLFIENVGLKLLAVALAIGLWLSVAGEAVIERGFEVPVGFENVPADLQVAGDQLGFINIRVREDDFSKSAIREDYLLQALQDHGQVKERALEVLTKYSFGLAIPAK